LRKDFSSSQISNQSELRRQAKMAIHAHPACVDMQIVCRPSLGMNTASTDAGFSNRPAPSLLFFSAYSVLSESSALGLLLSSVLPKPNKYRTDLSADANRCFTSGSVTRASLASRSAAPLEDS